MAHHLKKVCPLLIDGVVYSKVTPSTLKTLVGRTSLLTKGLRIIWPINETRPRKVQITRRAKVRGREMFLCPFYPLLVSRRVATRQLTTVNIRLHGQSCGKRSIAWSTQEKTRHVNVTPPPVSGLSAPRGWQAHTMKRLGQAEGSGSYLGWGCPPATAAPACLPLLSMRSTARRLKPPVPPQLEARVRLSARTIWLSASRCYILFPSHGVGFFLPCWWAVVGPSVSPPSHGEESRRGLKTRKCWGVRGPSPRKKNVGIVKARARDAGEITCTGHTPKNGILYHYSSTAINYSRVVFMK